MRRGPVRRRQELRELRQTHAASSDDAEKLPRPDAGKGAGKTAKGAADAGKAAADAGKGAAKGAKKAADGAAGAGKGAAKGAKKAADGAAGAGKGAAKAAAARLRAQEEQMRVKKSGSNPVVVTESDLLCYHTVVFIHNRHCTKLK